MTPRLCSLLIKFVNNKEVVNTMFTHVDRTIHYTRWFLVSTEFSTYVIETIIIIVIYELYLSSE